MTDILDKGKSRKIAAPHLYPLSSAPTDPIFYLSWPGWELYLTRRLNMQPQPLWQPLLLPDLLGPEKDFLALDQLARQAAELGPNIIFLDKSSPQSLPELAGAIKKYSPPAPEVTLAPLLDDRLYLALWTITEIQTRQSEIILAQALAKEDAMWSALRGEQEPSGGPGFYEDELGGDRRGDYAWKCWRRLTQNLLRPDDVVRSQIPEDDSETA